MVRHFTGLSPLQSIPGSPFDVLGSFSQPVTDLIILVGVTVGVYLLGRLVVLPVAAHVVQARNRNNPTIVTAVETYIRIGLLALGAFAGLVVTGQARHLLATDSAIIVAAFTFAFGIAGQEVLGSLISGFFLVADPDFNVGDWISWPDGEGTVEAVDFRVTRIRTLDNETIAVPNTELTTNALTRPFGRDRYRITERVFVPYDGDTEHALYELRQVAASQERVLDEPEPVTRIMDLGPDNVQLRAEFWIEDPARGDIAGIRSTFRREVKTRFREEGLSGAIAVDGDLGAGAADD